MALLSFLFNSKPKSANAAKERLQIIIARERTGRDGYDFLPALREELIAVIAKYTKVNPDDIKVSSKATWKCWMLTLFCLMQNCAVD